MITVNRDRGVASLDSVGMKGEDENGRAGGILGKESATMCMLGELQEWEEGVQLTIDVDGLDRRCRQL